MRSLHQSSIRMNNLALQSYVTNKKVLILLVFILILGSVLRFYGLENQSLWHDELSTYNVVNSNNIFDVIHKGVHFESKIPGYFVILYFFTKYLGDSESILRLPSAISGVLSILVMFLLGSRLFSYREGLIASALVAALWCPVHYSQEARPYSSLLLFTMLSTYFWIPIVRLSHKNSPVSYHTIVAYILAATISCYLHYYGLYLTVLQGLGATLVFIRRPKRLGSILLLYVPIVASILPWLPTTLKHYNSGEFSFIQSPTIDYFRLYLGFLFNFSNPLLLIVAILYFCLFVRILHTTLTSKNSEEARSAVLSPALLFVLLWLIVPYGGVHMASIMSAPVVHFRYLIISLPAAYLLVSRAITQLPLLRRIQAVLACTVVGLFLYHLVFIQSYYSKVQPGKAQFREAVAYVAAHDPLYDDSFIVGGVPALDYYFEKTGSSKRVDSYGGSRWDGPNQKRAMTDMINTRNPKYVWFISWHVSFDAEFVHFLNNNFTLIGLQRFVESDVWLFRNDKFEGGPDKR